MTRKQTVTSGAAALLFGSFAFAAYNYKVDPAHPRVGFSVRHFGLNDVKGNFDEFEGSLVLDEGSERHNPGQERQHAGSEAR